MPALSIHTAVSHRPVHLFDTLSFMEVLKQVKMFHITSLFESLAACFSKSARRQPTAVEALTGNVTEQQDIHPLPNSERSRAIKATNVMFMEHTLKKSPQDIIEAETKWGISFFRDYSGYEIEDYGLSRIVLSARYQNDPKKIRFVSCPKVIYTHGLEQEKRDLLEIKLNAVARSIPWDTLEDRFQIERDDWFKFSDVPEGMQEELQE